MRPGDPLVYIDPASASGDERMAEAELAQQMSVVARAQTEHDEAVDLLARIVAVKNGVPEQTLVAAKAKEASSRARWEEARAGLDVGKARIKREQARVRKHLITAPFAGVVVALRVDPGDLVVAGQLVARVISEPETTELATIEQELSERLAALLREPSDAAVREAVTDLRSRRELSRAGLARKTLRAPHAGVVGGVRIRAGQLVEPGMPVVTLLSEHGSIGVTALLPGQYLPLLAAGQTLRLTLDGFEKDVQALTIERVGDQIIGPNEAARYLGRELGDAFPLSGPVVLVHARLRSPSFHSGTTDYRYSHGSAVFVLPGALRGRSDDAALQRRADPRPPHLRRDVGAARRRDGGGPLRAAHARSAMARSARARAGGLAGNCLPGLRSPESRADGRATCSAGQALGLPGREAGRDRVRKGDGR